MRVIFLMPTSFPSRNTNEKDMDDIDFVLVLDNMFTSNPCKVTAVLHAVNCLTRRRRRKPCLIKF